MSDRPGDSEARMRDLNRLADEHRAQLLASLRATIQHVHPAQLKARASNNILDRMLGGIARGRASIVAHPARALGLAALAGALVARGPLLRLATKALATGKVIAMNKYRAYRNTKEGGKPHEQDS